MKKHDYETNCKKYEAYNSNEKKIWNLITFLSVKIFGLTFIGFNVQNQFSISYETNINNK